MPRRLEARTAASPLLAAGGYALVTLAFGLLVEQAGARGVAAVHVALGLAATLAWLLSTSIARLSQDAAARKVAPTAAPSGHHDTGR